MTYSEKDIFMISQCCHFICPLSNIHCSVDAVRFFSPLCVLLPDSLPVTRNEEPTISRPAYVTSSRGHAMFLPQIGNRHQVRPACGRGEVATSCQPWFSLSEPLIHFFKPFSQPSRISESGHIKTPEIA